MKPKKQDEPNTVCFGRQTNNLKIGIVGLPNVGKSTFFNIITNSSTSAENYPFCTIDPSEGRVAVPDSRYDFLCNLYQPKSRIPAFLTVIDIAGLVKGASSGAGLGNAFLSHIKAVDAIFHLIRVFEDDLVVHVEGDVDVVRDIEIIHSELRLKDVEFLNGREEACRRSRRGNETDKTKKLEYETIVKALEMINNGKDVIHGSWNEKEIEILNELQLLTAKRTVYLANVSAKDRAKSEKKNLAKIKKWIDEHSPGSILVPFSAELELSPETNKPGTGMLPNIIVAGYSALNLIGFFTVGHDEVRAWTIRKGTKALQSAGVIHTDFERGFIAAEVMKFEDIQKYGSETNVRAAGRYLLRGRDYPVEDGDIILFKFNVSAPRKKK